MYNTRRGGAYGSPANNVGQRRPQQQQGQLRPNFNKNNQQQQMPKTPQPPTIQPQLKTPPVQTPQKPAPVQTPQKPAQAAPVATPPPVLPVQKVALGTPVAKTKLELSAEALINQNKAVQNEPAAKEQVDTGDVEMKHEDEAKTDDSMDVSTTDENGVATGGPRKWNNNGVKRVKISRAEKIRRRNRVLKKVIQPKNALMVLNEIVGNTAFDLVEIPPNMSYGHGAVGGSNFKATVTVDGKVHEGYGKNKPSAKTAAAESALKHLVVTRMTAEAAAPPPAAVAPEAGSEEQTDGAKTETEGETKMEEDDVSICHLASFALYKLFNSWEDTSKMLSRSSSCTNLNAATGNVVPEPTRGGIKAEMKPSKKLPENPELMNPVMLLNQMFPNAVYEEVCKTGTPPKLVFTMKCTIDDNAFIGNGSNKKAARKEAAYYACKTLLSINYPEEEVQAVE